MEIIIKKEEALQKIDKYVLKTFTSISRNQFFKMIRTKDIKVNNQRINRDYILKENDLLYIYLTKDNQLKSSENHNNINLNIPINIIYEDENILIVNKDKMSIIQGKSTKTIYNLTELIRAKYQSESSFVISPAHRLDTNTTGLVIYGKSVECMQALMQLFKSKVALEKYYLVAVFGDVVEDSVYESYLEKKSDNYVINHEFETENSKYAKLSFKVLARGDKYSILLVKLYTGRTHQIRVQLASLGHPVILDSKYGNFKLNHEFEREFNYKSILLHSYKIKIVNPPNILSYLNNLLFEAPFSPIFSDLARNIQKIHDF